MRFKIMEDNKIIKETNNNRCYTVYMHTSPSGKRYIGITKQSVEERWKNGWGYYTQLIFYRAILKYSFENFKHEIIASGLSKEEAIDLEKELIKKYQTTDRRYGYNITEGGETMSPNCHWIGSHHTEESKRKISEANKGRPRPDAAERNKGNNYKSLKVYQYTINGEYIDMYLSTRDVEKKLGIIHNKISDCCRNKIFSVDGFCWSYLNPDFFSIEEKRREVEDYLNDKELKNRKNKEVVQYSKKTFEFIGIYKSISDASINTGIHKSAISNCITGLAKSAGGFIWRYASDIQDPYAPLFPATSPTLSETA